MINHTPRTSRFWLNAATVVARIEERHLTHADLADALGLSRSQVRRALLASPVLSGLAQSALWDRVAAGGQP